MDVKPDSEPRADAQTDLLSDVRTAILQIEAEEGLSNWEAKAELLKRFGR